MYQNPLCPTDLGIIMSYQCQCACKHCLYNCGPRWKDWMSPQTLRDALQATRAWNHRFQIHLTGGEPFLNFPLLLEGARLAAELDIPCYVETNAGWCLHEDDVAAKFVALREAGLNAILISCSPFHAEKIPPARTFLAIRKALDAFGQQGTIVYLPHCLEQVQLFDAEKTTPLERYVERFGLERAGRMLWDGYSIISGGRSGYALGHLTRQRPAAAFKGQDCFLEIIHAHHSHFDLYGNYISWFCGGLTIGDWHNLPQVLDDFRARHYPPLVDILVHFGPFGLWEMAVEEYGYQELPDGYAGKCHLCVDVRGCLYQRGEFAELQPGGFYEDVLPAKLVQGDAVSDQCG
ncbi:MAG: radical SAM protein [Anaerolineae bacterium]